MDTDTAMVTEKVTMAMAVTERIMMPIIPAKTDSFPIIHKK